MKEFAGTRALFRLALRRDRVVMPIWVLVLGIIPAATAGLYDQLYPDAASRASLTATSGANPTLSLIYGPAFDLSTAGGFAAWRYLMFIGLFLALACLFTVTRHTRQEEETGRQELLSSTVTGRYAPVTAALLVAWLAALATGAVATIGMIASHLPAAGSIAFGVGITLVGVVFAGIAAIAAQFAEFSRTANGIASAILGVAFFLRAVGDSATDLGWLSWLSPLGWSSRLRPFAGERWWVLLLMAGTAIVVTAIAYWLLPRRDIGMGILATRLGPAGAAPGLRSPFALAWRLHRGMLIGWLAGFAAGGALLGSMADGIGGLVGNSAQTQQIIQRMGGASALVAAFLAVTANLLGMIASLYAVQATLRMRSEETAVRLEPVLATRTRRLGLAASHLAFSFLGSALLLAVAGTAAGLLHGLRAHDVSGQLPAVLGATVAQLPAVWVVAGIAVLVFGVAPKAATAAWSVASLSLALALYGPILQLPQVVVDISPFTHIPKLPSAPLTMTPMLWLTGIAIVALAAGLAGFRRRDIG
ncbi:ABC transporter permease [Amycolatopsis taiwanensis]|uniref:Exporter of polyketide antibiotics n=1 Tax=Amycolatopsis taiwanensis TaxID=342230 RepID=A0A9W6QXL3_9PSEU|nr:ABC transporter permease [Amycolatopsis taiwanensis]GLY63867.1 exporter of polyketide antibiotics [Amycolatopsis taiwanensis]